MPLFVWLHGFELSPKHIASRWRFSAWNKLVSTSSERSCTPAVISACADPIVVHFSYAASAPNSQRSSVCPI
jgi:hypothetical protein